MTIAYNPENLKVGDRVYVDNNPESVEIIGMTAKGVFCYLKADSGYEWEVMTYRVSKQLNS